MRESLTVLERGPKDKFIQPRVLEHLETKKNLSETGLFEVDPKNSHEVSKIKFGKQEIPQINEAVFNKIYKALSTNKPSQLAFLEPAFVGIGLAFNEANFQQLVTNFNNAYKVQARERNPSTGSTLVPVGQEGIGLWSTIACIRQRQADFARKEAIESETKRANEYTPLKQVFMTNTELDRLYAIDLIEAIYRHKDNATQIETINLIQVKSSFKSQEDIENTFNKDSRQHTLWVDRLSTIQEGAPFGTSLETVIQPKDFINSAEASDIINKLQRPEIFGEPLEAVMKTLGINTANKTKQQQAWILKYVYESLISDIRGYYKIGAFDNKLVSKLDYTISTLSQLMTNLEPSAFIPIKTINSVLTEAGQQVAFKPLHRIYQPKKVALAKNID